MVFAPEPSTFIRHVNREPNWRGVPFSLTYLLPSAERDAHDLVRICAWALREGLPNPRVVLPSMVRLASLFHPRLYYALTEEDCKDWKPGRFDWTAANFQPSETELTRNSLQSTLFLAGVTLSAAIVQSRFSVGTIASKYDRLWEAGELAGNGVVPELAPLRLHDRIQDLLAALDADPIDILLCLRRLFIQTWSLICPTGGECEQMREADRSTSLDARFGFVHELRGACHGHAEAIIAYGSSVTSENYADYDVVLVTDDPEAILRRLARTSPTWNGKELNLSVYSPDEFLFMQRLSGDNLADYGMCLWGETFAVRKPVNSLLVRNFSFAAVRQRQQMGMLSKSLEESVGQEGDDMRNLFEYFVKIPANVAKGTFGALGERLPKEDVHRWLKSVIQFDTEREQARAIGGDLPLALARSTIATGRVIEKLNQRVELFRDPYRKQESAEVAECRH